MGEISTASNIKAETAVSNALEAFSSAPGFNSLIPVSVSARVVLVWSRVLGALQVTAGLQGESGGDRKERQIFIWPGGKSNFSHFASYTLGLYTCLAHTLIFLGIIKLGPTDVLQFI